MWYSYYGGYDSTVDNFNAGRSSDDKLYLPNGSDIFNCSVANFSHPYGDDLNYYDDVLVYVGIKNIISYSYGSNLFWGNNSDNRIENNHGNSNLWGGREGNDTLSESDGGHDII